MYKVEELCEKNDQIVSQTSTRQNTTLTTKKKSYFDEIRTQKLFLHERTAADQRLSPLGYRDR